MPLRPDDRGEQVPAVDAHVVPRPDHPLTAELHCAELLNIRLVHRPSPLKPRLRMRSTTAHTNGGSAS